MMIRKFTILSLVVCSLFFAPVTNSTEAAKPADLPYRFYQYLAEEQKNVNFSPLSMEMAFTMLQMASDTKTKETLDQLFGFKDGHYGTTLELDYAKSISSKRENGEPELYFGNAVWVKSPKLVLPSYRKTLAKFLNGDVLPLDLKKMNDWVSNKTHHLITHLIDKISPETHSLFVNTLYLKAKWEHPFKKDFTDEESFQTAPHVNLRVQMMRQTSLFNYHESQTTKWLELKYKSSPLSMIIAIPSKKFDLHSIEDSLSAEKMSRIVASLKTENVDLKLPKFKFTSKFSLKNMFIDMGYADLFKTGDFSRIVAKEDLPKDLFISDILQATSISVDEDGTEAAAATAVTLERASINLNPPKKFYADQPFLFLIRNTKTGAVYFIGRVSNPIEN